MTGFRLAQQRGQARSTFAVLTDSGLVGVVVQSGCSSHRACWAAASGAGLADLHGHFRSQQAAAQALMRLTA